MLPSSTSDAHLDPLLGEAYITSGKRPRSTWVLPVRRAQAFVLASLLGTAYVIMTVVYRGEGWSVASCTLPEAEDLASAHIGSDVSHSPYVHGQPTASFRDNLLNNTQYITSFANAGWTNDVMIRANLIYLGMVSGRIPVLPPFIANEHLGLSARNVPFSEVFDIEYLRQHIPVPVIEWHDVKQPDSEVVDEIGCWSIWDTMHGHPRNAWTQKTLHLDVSWTAVPGWVPTGHDDHASFWNVASLTFPQHYSSSLSTPRPSEIKELSLAPDTQLACFDMLYYMHAGPEVFEMSQDYSPAWRDVATYFRWTPHVENMAMDYLRRAWRLGPSEDIPPYIALHVRHGDFLDHCRDRPADECVTPVSDFAHTVDAMKRELWHTQGIDVRHVVMTSDERDPDWWAQVFALGWTKIDHESEETEARLGPWYPIFIDAVIQGGGVGLVGSSDSTMSLLAGRRVQDWQGGLYSLIPSRIWL